MSPRRRFRAGWRKSMAAGTPALEVNLAMRGVVVPPGRHEVRFAYRPTSVYLGALLLAIALASAAALRVVDRRLMSPDKAASCSAGNSV